MRKEFFNKRKHLPDLYMVNCGYEDCCLNCLCKPHTRKYFLIHYVTKGYGFFEVNSKKYEVKTGDIFVIRPEEIVTYYSPDTENTWSFCWFGFSGSNALQYLEESGIKEGIDVLSLVQNELLSIILNCLEYVESVNFEASQLILNSFLVSALAVICKKINHKPQKYKSTHIVERAVRYIEYNYMNDISPSSISEYFKKTTGSSPEHYIINYRIKKAADLLKSSGYSIGEIASFVGIDDIYYFSKLFKKVKGIAPSVYRKM